MGASAQARPLYASGGVGAASAAAIGLAMLTTRTLVGWIAAPPTTFGDDIVDVFRIAVRMWLVGHHVELVTPDGRMGLFPIGLLVLPGLLLYHSGSRLVRACGLVRLRHAAQAALALASPYAAIAGTLALIGRDDTVQPSMLQALVTGFLLAFLAGGLGALRQLLKERRIPWRGCCIPAASAPSSSGCSALPQCSQQPGLRCSSPVLPQGFPKRSRLPAG